VTTARQGIPCAIVIGALLAAGPAFAQDLDPRAYAKVPINSTVAITGFAFSSGSVLTDPTLPVQNVHANVSTPSVGVARTFGLLGKTAQALAALPYSWAEVTGEINEQAARTTRSGLADMRLRLSVLLAGAPAMTLQQMMKSPRKPIIGTSLTISAPTGQYYPHKFVNLGTNRWAFKPEIALSYPLGKKWLADVYAATWLFTTNDAFYPGTSTRNQSVVGALQAHISYSFTPRAWAAFDSTWYSGGAASVNGGPAGTSLSATRVGATLAFPVGNRHAVKIAYSTGAIVRFGANFNTVSVGWQTMWLERRALTK